MYTLHAYPSTYSKKHTPIHAASDDKSHFIKKNNSITFIDRTMIAKRIQFSSSMLRLQQITQNASQIFRLIESEEKILSKAIGDNKSSHCIRSIRQKIEFLKNTIRPIEELLMLQQQTLNIELLFSEAIQKAIEEVDPDNQAYYVFSEIIINWSKEERETIASNTASICDVVTQVFESSLHNKLESINLDLNDKKYDIDVDQVKANAALIGYEDDNEISSS